MLSRTECFPNGDASIGQGIGNRKDRAAGACLQSLPEIRAGAGQHLEAGLHHLYRLAKLVDVSGAILHANDVGMPRQCRYCFGRQVIVRHAGNVVQQHRQL